MYKNYDKSEQNIVIITCCSDPHFSGEGETI